jgi:hypothetical protein
MMVEWSHPLLEKPLHFVVVPGESWVDAFWRQLGGFALSTMGHTGFNNGTFTQVGNDEQEAALNEDASVLADTPPSEREPEFYLVYAEKARAYEGTADQCKRCEDVVTAKGTAAEWARRLGVRVYLARVEASVEVPVVFRGMGP